MRALVRRGELNTIRASAALAALRAVALTRYPFAPFLDRVWELRDNITVYDAWYVALAEELGAELVTADDRLVGAPGPHCAVRSLVAVR